MKVKAIILTVIAFLLVSVASVPAQHAGHGEHKPPVRSSKKKSSAQKRKVAPRSTQMKKATTQADDKQETHQHDSPAMNLTEDSHPALAMAYAESITTFAKALRDQVEATRSVDTDFALSVVDEMKRSLDAIRQHHHEHKPSDPAGNKSQMDTIAKEMETKMSALRQSILALDRETQAEAPSTSQVLQRADEIIRLAGEMSKSHSGHADHSR